MTDKDNYSLKEFIQTQFQAMDKKLDEFFSSHRDLEKTVVANKERITHINTKINTTISAFGAEIKKDREQMREYISLKFDPILAQVTKTNGRVSFNEKMIWLAMGAIMILAPIFSWFILDYIEFKQNLSDKISESVETAPGNYEFEISK